MKEEKMAKEIEKDQKEIIFQKIMININKSVSIDLVEIEEIKVIEEVIAKIDITEGKEIEEKDIDQDQGQKKKIQIIRKEGETVEIKVWKEKVEIKDQ